MRNHIQFGFKLFHETFNFDLLFQKKVTEIFDYMHIITINYISCIIDPLEDERFQKI